MSGNGAPRHFHRHDRSGAFQERDHQHAQHVEEGVLFFRGLGHVGRDRSHQPVAQQNAEKRSDQRRGDLVSDFFRRAAERAHGDDDAEHGGHNPQAGQRIGHGAERGGGLRGVVVMHFHVEVEHLVEVEGVDCR